MRNFPRCRRNSTRSSRSCCTPSSPNLLVSKKQVRTLEDFKGLKVRVLGGPPTEMAKALGAVPTLIPMPDVYQSLDKGVVDGAAAPWEAVQGFRLYEVAKNYTIAPFYVAYFSVCANKQKWQSLPKDVRDAIMSVSGLPGAKFWGKNFFDTAEEGVIERAKAGNYELNRYQVPARPACALDQARRRADLGRVGQEDGRQGPQGRPRHPQHRPRSRSRTKCAIGAHRSIARRNGDRPAIHRQVVVALRARAGLCQRARGRRDDVPHLRGCAQPLPSQPPDHRGL